MLDRARRRPTSSAPRCTPSRPPKSTTSSPGRTSRADAADVDAELVHAHPADDRAAAAGDEHASRVRLRAQHAVGVSGADRGDRRRLRCRPRAAVADRCAAADRLHLGDRGEHRHGGREVDHARGGLGRVAVQREAEADEIVVEVRARGGSRRCSSSGRARRAPRRGPRRPRPRSSRAGSSVKSRSAASESAKCVNTPATSTSSGVPRQYLQESGEPVGLDTESPHTGVDLDVHPGATPGTGGRGGRGLDGVVVEDRGLDAGGDERLVAARVGAPDDEHRDPEVGDRRAPRTPRPRRARSRRRPSRPRPRAGARGRSRSTSPSPSPARRSRRARRAPRYSPGSRRCRPRPACGARTRAGQATVRTSPNGVCSADCPSGLSTTRPEPSPRRHRRSSRTPRPRGRWRR